MATTRRPSTALLAGLFLLVSASARAGLLDSPAPNFDGVPGKVIYRMGPVLNDPGWADTLIRCTNLADAPAGVAVEVFDGQNRSAGAPTRATLTPNSAVTFVTSAGAESAGGTVIVGLPLLDDGKARVSATSARISCSAMHRLRSSDGTIKEAPLELLKRVPALD